MCFSPKKVTRPDGTIKYYPCGHCLSCLKAYQDSWNARLNEELKIWNNVHQERVCSPPVLFFTLTYRNEAIPCSYLCVTSRGYYLTDKKPSCEILPFWTSYSESPSAWRERRKQILERYWRQMRIVSLTRERRPTIEEIYKGDFEYVPSFRTVLRERGGKLVALNLHSWELLYSGDLPSDDADIIEFDASNTPVHDDITVSPDDGGTLLFALEFHTIEKKPVQDAFKRFRMALSRKYPEIFKQDVNPRQKRTWVDLDGNEQPYPSAALTSTFHYFITSEYGDRYNRPHLHGCLFGVTFDEFQLFVQDWESRFGHVDVSVYDASRGGFTYITKYCSKGGYEHPLCRRDFIYKKEDGTVSEYHSKDFETCMDLFGINRPLVSPTFHLISKGIGAAYSYQAEILNYFGVILSPLYTDSGRLRYVSHDDSRALHVKYRPEQLADYLHLVDGLPDSRCLKLVHFADGSLTVKRYSIQKTYKYRPDPVDPSRKIQDGVLKETFVKESESHIPADAIVSAAVENSMLNLKYHRTYVQSSPYVYRSPRWHFLGNSSVPLHQKTTELSLPRYYRRVLLSPLSSVLRASASERVNPSPYEVAARTLRDFGSEDPRTIHAVAVLAAHKDRNQSFEKSLWKSAQNCYNKPRLNSLIS